MENPYFFECLNQVLKYLPDEAIAYRRIFVHCMYLNHYLIPFRYPYSDTTLTTKILKGIDALKCPIRARMTEIVMAFFKQARGDSLFYFSG